jgi:hypothetical protein
MVEEIFGPVITVCFFYALSTPSTADPQKQVFVFEDSEYEQTLKLIDSTSQYALTGAMYVGLFSIGTSSLPGPLASHLRGLP